jgi:hypothetical protein
MIPSLSLDRCFRASHGVAPASRGRSPLPNIAETESYEGIAPATATAENEVRRSTTDMSYPDVRDVLLLAGARTEALDLDVLIRARKPMTCAADHG